MIMAGNPLDGIFQGVGKIISLSATAREQQQQTNNAQFLALAVIIGIIVTLILFIGSLRRALKNCSAKNRVLPPGTAWLLLVPLFNILWCFVMVIVVAMSLRNERTARRLTGPSLPGIGTGLAACIFNAVCLIQSVPAIFGIASFVCWIVYWITIAGHSRSLERNAMGDNTLNSRMVYPGDHQQKADTDLNDSPLPRPTSRDLAADQRPASDTSEPEQDVFVERLQNLQRLYDDGLISQTEYDQKRRDLMNLAF